MAFEFLHDIQEARMTRNSNNQRMLTYNDCKDRAFLILMMLQVMRNYRSHRDTAAKYAFKTVMYRTYDMHRVDGSDLFNLFYFITGDKKALGKLKNPGAAERERKVTRLNVGNLNGYLRDLAKSEPPSNKDVEKLFQVERELNIQNSDYKTIRRRLASFDTDSVKEKQATVTRLLFAGRARLSDSDFLAKFTKLALDKNLEDMSATDPEFDVSIPDNVTQTDVRNYRFLVPIQNLPFVAKFIENTVAGRSVVARFIQAYAPIVIMIDDIVKAGPGYVQQLKILHQRAKKARK